MNNFKSIFATELNEYLSIRQMTLEEGTCKIDRHVLEDFDNYFTGKDTTEKVITEEIINGWIAHLKNKKNHSRTISHKVGNLRGFLRYLRYCGVPVFMPQCPKCCADYVPYIFSDDELDKMFYHADTTKSSGSATNFEAAMLIRLLYGCGLRHGEALKLIRSDVDFKKGTLLLRQAKNKKQRIVPMHQSLTKILMQYCVAMGIYDLPEAFLFPGKKPNAPISMSSMEDKFHSALKSANVYIASEKPGQRGQCLHCLRHVFAVKSFAQAEKNGRSTADSVPYLSVYLGHFDMDGTEKYLKFSSDIFPEHTAMFEAYSSGVFTVLGGAFDET